MTTKVFKKTVVEQPSNRPNERPLGETHRREYWERFCSENPSYHSCKIHDN